MAKTAKSVRSKSKRPAAKSQAKKKAAPQVRKRRAPARKKKMADVIDLASRRKGFMWKLLEQKEKLLKEQAQKQTNPIGREGFKPNERQFSFTKFAGPRRRVG